MLLPRDPAWATAPAEPVLSIQGLEAYPDATERSPTTPSIGTPTRLTLKIATRLVPFQISAKSKQRSEIHWSVKMFPRNSTRNVTSWLRHKSVFQYVHTSRFPGPMSERKLRCNGSTAEKTCRSGRRCVPPQG